MTATLIGTLCDELGLVKLTTVEGRRGEIRCRAWSTSSLEVRSVQNPTIPVNIGHDERAVVGEVVHLERSLDAPRRLWAVCHANVRIPDNDEPPWFFSSETLRDEHGILLTGVGLTEYPLQKANLPVTFLPGRVDYRGCTSRHGWEGLSHGRRDMLERAAQTFYDRRGRRNWPLRVHEPRQHQLEGRNNLHPAEMAEFLEDQFYGDKEFYDEAWELRPLEYRPGRIISVH